MKIAGIFPPITTPFDGKGDVDVRGLRSNATRWMRTGLAGLVTLGSNGESGLLDEDESARVTGAVREAVPADRLLIAGVGRESTRATIAAARQAASVGADAALVRTPSFFKNQMTTDALLHHYRAVADESPIPVILYNFTNLFGVTLTVDATLRLTEHPNIVGIKESDGDVGKVGDLCAQIPRDFSVVVGAAHAALASFCVGAAGAIVAIACVAPDLCVRLHQLSSDGRLDEALDLQRRLTPLARLVTGIHGVPGLKAAMDLAGYVGGEPRSPLQPASAAAIEAIRQQILALQQLPATV